MHTVNHVAVGVSIALLIKQPTVALPLAFVSHFALDALPHYGLPGPEGYKELFKRWQTWIMFTVDILGTLFILTLIRSEEWYVFAAAFLATSPDLIWIYRFFWFERFGKKPPAPGWLTRFHMRIQWLESPKGIIIEIPVTIFLIWYIWQLV
jgi:hypothetical protein